MQSRLGGVYRECESVLYSGVLEFVFAIPDLKLQSEFAELAVSTTLEISVNYYWRIRF